MNRHWSDTLKRLAPYTPGEQAQRLDIIKLNTNEHALAPSEKAASAGRALSIEALRRYPDPNSRVLRAAIAASEGLDVDQVFVGNGSDEVLAFAWTAFLADDDSVPAIPEMTYTFYPVWGQLLGHGVERIPMTSGLEIDIASMAAWEGPLVFPNPNAPTGRALSRAAVKDLLESNLERLVVVDEAYFGFGAETAAPLITEYDNLLVTRSFSKSHALAGLRVGYALGNASLIEGLRRVKDSFNSYPIDAHAQAVAGAAINDIAWFTQASSTIEHNREALTNGLQSLGFDVLPSLANFVLAAHPRYSGEALTNMLKRHNILVRSWSSEALLPWVRITVGTHDQQLTVLATLSEVLSAD